MKTTLPVQGDGITHYYCQGPTFDPNNLWDPNESVNLKDKGPVEGTDLKDLCNLVGNPLGGIPAGATVKLIGSDGYSATFYWNNISNDSRYKFVICWYNNGSYPDTGYSDGMQLVFFDSMTNNASQHVFGNQDMHDFLPPNDWHYYYDNSIAYPSCDGISVKYISQINIYLGGGTGWNLHLSGPLSENISQDAFEEGVACQHGVTWTDSKGHVWGGMPLWLLVGRVDDNIIHGPDAFNDSLAAQGHTVTVSGSDGYSYSFPSQTVAENDNIFVANTLDGSPISGQNPPLKLVGSGLTSGKQQVGNVSSIVLSNMPWTLQLNGASTYSMNRSDFQTRRAANTLNTSDASGNWSGIALWRLVALVDDGDPTTFNNNLSTQGYTVNVIGSDGFTKSFSSAVVANNNSMIVADVLNGSPLPSNVYPLKLVGANLSNGQKVGSVAEIQLIGLPTRSTNNYTLTYNAGTGGSINGTTPQTVASGGNGTAVTAVANNYYHFVNWSDSSTANPRTDTNVTGNITVTANFASTNGSSASGTTSINANIVANYLALTVPAGINPWNMVVGTNDITGSANVQCNNNWQLKVVDQDTNTSGHMTEWLSGVYTPSTHLTDPLTVGCNTSVSLSGTPHTIATGTPAGQSGNNGQALTITFIQPVLFADPILTGGYSYHIVVTFTASITF